MPMPSFRARHAGAFVAALIVLLAADGAAASCVDEDGEAARSDAATTAAAAAPAPPADPRIALRSLVRDALERSHQVGAARLLAEAADDDVRETRAGKDVQASASTGIGPGGSSSLAGSESSAAQFRASLNVGQLLYDGGRLNRLIDWRTQMAESARQGHLSAQEQLALQTVTLALERSRFRQQAAVYSQYVQRMGCLVQALDTIVRNDRGRASELVQARKSQQQAEISLVSAQSQLRGVEVQLRRFVGDELPGTEGLSGLLLQVAPLAVLVADVERSSELAALAAQAGAMSSYAEAVVAGTSPQLGWSISGTQSYGSGGSRGNVRYGSYAVGLTLNIPLLSPGVPPAGDAARKRARAAELQRADALETRRFRVAEVYEQTLASFDRVRRYGAVLRDSDQLRGFTLQQWQQLGRRSLFDVMAAEAEHFNLRVAHVNALHDGQQLNANLLSLGKGLNEWLR